MKSKSRTKSRARARTHTSRTHTSRAHTSRSRKPKTGRKTKRKSSTPCPTKMNDKGNNGCIVFCNSCGDFTQGKYATKIIYGRAEPINPILHHKLRELNELHGFRFNIYEGINDQSCRRTTFNNPDVIECLTKHHTAENDTQFVFQKLLKSFGLPGRYTVAQDKYLKESIRILNANGIRHGDLHAFNVMQDENKNPIIIDWDNAEYEPNTIVDNSWMSFDNIITEPEVVTTHDSPIVID